MTSQNDPLAVARRYRPLAVRARRAHRAARQLSGRSYRIGKLIDTALGRWAPYGRLDQSVAIHAGPQLYSEGQRRLLLVSQELTLSGAPRIVAEIAGVFAQAGWLVTVVSPSDGPFRPALQQHATVIVDPTVLAERSPLMRRLAAVTDLAIGNTVLADGAVCGLAPRVPTLWYLHEVSLLAERLAAAPQTGRALAAAHQVWAGSEHCASLARPHRPDVKVQPYGVKAPAPSPAGREVDGRASPVRIAVFSSIEPRKGQDLAVEALALLSAAERERVRLTLYGRVLDQPFADGVAALAVTMPQIAWGGELSSSDYAVQLAATDVVLVSSRDDTLPLVSIDALGSGRVLMCTPGTGTSVWIEDGESGFVAAETSAVGIAAMLSRALACRDDWSEIARGGRAVFDTSFSAEAFARVVLATAETLLGTATRHG